MKKIYLFFVFLFSMFLTGCFQKDELVDAVADINESSYTANTEMTVSVKMQGITIEVTSKGFVETDNTQMYMQQEMTVLGQKETVRNYAVFGEETVDAYVKMGDDAWQRDTIDLDEYVGQTDMFNIDVVDSFELVDGVYVGNCETLAAQVEEYLVDSLADTGLTDTTTEINFTLTKYNITLEEGHMKMVDIEANMSMTVEGQLMETTMLMKYEFSKIGETEVTIPENLPTK